MKRMLSCSRIEFALWTTESAAEDLERVRAFSSEFPSRQGEVELEKVRGTGSIGIDPVGSWFASFASAKQGASDWPG